jgi:hypothetical protein
MFRLNSFLFTVKSSFISPKFWAIKRNTFDTFALIAHTCLQNHSQVHSQSTCSPTWVSSVNPLLLLTW